MTFEIHGTKSCPNQSQIIQCYTSKKKNLKMLVESQTVLTVIQMYLKKDINITYTFVLWILTFGVFFFQIVKCTLSLWSTNCMEIVVTTFPTGKSGEKKAVILFTPLSEMYDLVLDLILLLTAIIYQCVLTIDNANLKEAIDRTNSTFELTMNRANLTLNRANLTSNEP